MKLENLDAEAIVAIEVMFERVKLFIVLNDEKQLMTSFALKDAH